MKAKYKLVFNRKNKLNKEGKALIQIEIYKDGKRKYISTGIYIKPNEWNEKKKEVTNNNSNYLEINNLLRKTINDLEEYEIIEKTKGKELSLEDINLKKNETESFYSFFEKEISLSSSGRSAKSGYINTLRDLKAIRKEILFSDINYKLITDFDVFLKNKKLHHNTISKRHSFLKKFINLAIKKDLLDVNKNPYKNFKLTRIEGERVALENEEISRIEKLIFTEDTKTFELVRDIFLFSCFTGLRFNEIQQLSSFEISNTENEVYLNIRQNKTKKLLQLPLHLLFNGKPVKIVEKYKDKNTTKIFPFISNQHTNRILKLISFLAQTKRLMSFHIARHTFGTFLAESTLDPYLIKELMNHSDIKTSMIYIHKSKKRMENKLRNIDWD